MEVGPQLWKKNLVCRDSNKGEKWLEMKKRPSQGTHKSQPRKGTAVRGRRRLNEYPWRLKCQKNGEAGFGEDWWRLRSARRCRTSLLVKARHRKVGHVPSCAGRGIQTVGEKRHVDWCLAPVLWEKLQISSLRSWWCGRCQKKSPENKSWRWWGFSDHDMTDRKTLRDGKGDRNETRSLDGFPELITRVNLRE